MIENRNLTNNETIILYHLDIKPTLSVRYEIPLTPSVKGE
jgi:hypothetical protein